MGMIKSFLRSETSSIASQLKSYNVGKELGKNLSSLASDLDIKAPEIPEKVKNIKADLNLNLPEIKTPELPKNLPFDIGSAVVPDIPQALASVKKLVTGKGLDVKDLSFQGLFSGFDLNSFFNLTSLNTFRSEDIPDFSKELDGFDINSLKNELPEIEGFDLSKYV